MNHDCSRRSFLATASAAGIGLSIRAAKAAALVLFSYGCLLADSPATQPAHSFGSGQLAWADGASSQPVGQFELNKAWRGQRFAQLAKDAAAAFFSPDGRQVGYVRQSVPAGLPQPGGPLTSRPTPLKIDNTVVVVDLVRGQSEEATLNKAAPKRVEFLAWSADGRTLFAADGGQMWAVNVSDKGLEPRILVNGFADGEIRSLALTADHNHLICRYSPKAPSAARFAWMTSDFVVLDMEGKQTARYNGKESGWGFRFSAKDYFAATGRPGLLPRDGYVWGVVPLARINDGARLAAVREEPAKHNVLPLAVGLRTELASWTGKPGPGAYSKLDQFTDEAARGTTVNYRASAQANRVLRVRIEGFYTMWGGSRKGTYGVRGKEEKVLVSVLDVAGRKFGPEVELPLPGDENTAGVNSRPAYELMDFSGDGRLAVFWYYFNYRGDTSDRNLSGLAVVDVVAGTCRTVPLLDQIHIDRLHPPQVQPHGQLLLFTSATNVWLCDPHAKGQPVSLPPSQ